MTHTRVLSKTSPLNHILAIVFICVVWATPSGAQESTPPPVDLRSIDPGTSPDLSPMQPPVLLSRPALPAPANPSMPSAAITWSPAAGSIRRISAKFFLRDMEWVTPRNNVRKLMAKSCSALEFVSDEGQADAAFETTFNDETSVWTTVVKQNHEEVQRFYTFAYPKRAPVYLADQICFRSGYQPKLGKEVEIRLPHGKWEGKVFHQVGADRAEEFEGSVTIDEKWVTIRGVDGDLTETRFIPITSVRGLRSIGQKKGLPPVSSSSWDSLLQGSAECGDGAGYCFAGGAAALGAYTVVRPVLNMFVPTHHTIELLFLEGIEPRTVSIELKPSSYAQFAKAIARGSKAAYSVAKPVIVTAY